MSERTADGRVKRRVVTMEEFSRRVLVAMGAANVSIQTVARVAEVSPSTVVSWRNRRQFPVTNKFGALCIALGVSADSLLFVEEQ